LRDLPLVHRGRALVQADVEEGFSEEEVRQILDFRSPYADEPARESHLPRRIPAVLFERAAHVNGHVAPLGLSAFPQALLSCLYPFFEGIIARLSRRLGREAQKGRRHDY